ncbi:hypothetical protein P5P86_03315 [Nocardioides sp. BP30]|uniref:hypothetical protein n=1 Tax=Nocardioides sp. BP30 TaxID=3036374 RepID=UPI0024695370|nr:hypothetical protein [Nocardioides sp. BP30]WGL52858.1 hypothetical protein P5P86_03315 [Nocardioides sp. BP30]
MTAREASPGEVPGGRLEQQRVRNRIIDYLELVASFEQQLAFEQDVPIAYVPYEVINLWEERVGADLFVRLAALPVLDEAEGEALQIFEPVWERAAEQLPHDFPLLSEVQELGLWKQLRVAGEEALAVFQRRGRMPEDREVPW